MFGIALIGLCLLVLLYYIQWYKDWRRKYGALDKVPGPRNYPVIGNMWTLALVPRDGK